MARTTVVLADAHPLIRVGVRACLMADADFTVVGEAADGRRSSPG